MSTFGFLNDDILQFLLLKLPEGIILESGVEKLISKFAVCKQFCPIRLKGIKSAPQVQDVTYELDDIHIENLKFSGYIKNFEEVVKSKIDRENLGHFYKNVNSLSIGDFKEEKSNDSSIIVGKYNVNDNIISLLEDNNVSALYHELFHMSSSAISGKNKFSGFLCQGAFHSSIGNGLNEGYTVLISHRYFGNNDFESTEYKYLSVAADFLERIVGQNEMESFYLNSDLKGLVNELRKYSSDKEIINFIAGLDFIGAKLFNSKNTLIDELVLSKCFKNVSSFLSNAFRRSVQSLADAGKYPKELVSTVIEEFDARKERSLFSLPITYRFDFAKSFKHSLNKISLKNSLEGRIVTEGVKFK